MTDIQSVKEFWGKHINNEYYTNQVRNSAEYWQEIEKKRYDHHYHLRELFETLRQEPKIEGNRLLEIGCGIGIDSRRLRDCGFEVTAIDLTEEAIELARMRNEADGTNIRFMVANAESLPFDDGEMDYVYSFGVLHHTPDIGKAVDEIYRVLKPGGKAYIMLYATNSLVNFIHRAFHLPYESPRDRKDHCPVVYTYNAAGIRKLFSKFRKVESTKEYPFTYGFRHMTCWIPHWCKRPLGRLIGWHNMIFVEK